MPGTGKGPARVNTDEQGPPPFPAGREAVGTRRGPRRFPGRGAPRFLPSPGRRGPRAQALLSTSPAGARAAPHSLLYCTPLAKRLCSAWFMDCSPAGMFLSRPGACSDPTSFLSAENIFLLPRPSPARPASSVAATAAARRGSHHVLGLGGRAPASTAARGLSRGGSAPAPAAPGTAYLRPSAPPS